MSISSAVGIGKEHKIDPDHAVGNLLRHLLGRAGDPCHGCGLLSAIPISCLCRAVNWIRMVAMVDRLAARGLQSLLFRAFVDNQAARIGERLVRHELRKEPDEILGPAGPSILYG